MNPVIKPRVRSLWAPKIGETAKDYQDFFSFCVPLHDGSIIRAAIADGATESAFAARWAQELSKRFLDNPLSGSVAGSDVINDWLAPAQEVWRESIDWGRLPWHGIDKAKAGALATFLGVTVALSDAGSLRVDAVAVGDCELFVVDRQGQANLRFPFTEVSEFNNYPDLVSSNPVRNQGVVKSLKVVTECIAVEDRLVLATDAVAACLLKGGTGWMLLGQMGEEEFADWLGAARLDGEIRNDDTTLAVVEFVVEEDLEEPWLGQD